MPTIPYRNKEGKRVPGVTTIIGNIGWNTGPLNWWAFNQGMEAGLAISRGEPAPSSIREVTAAAEAGTIAHAMVAEYLKTGKVMTRDELRERFRSNP